MTELDTTTALPGLPTTSEAPAGETGDWGRVRRAIRIIQDQLGPGDVAALRRLDADEVASPVFWRLLSQLDVPLTPSLERRWALVLRVLALVGDGTGPLSLGWALAAVEANEDRVERLLRASGRMLERQIFDLTRLLISRGQAFDPWQLCALVLLVDDEKAEDNRRKIARHFFTTKSRDAAEGTP